MTLSPELLAMVADVPAATDAEIEYIGAKAHGSHARNTLSLIARIVAERKVAESDDPHHRYAVVSSDYNQPFLLGAYPKLENAIRAQGGHPEKWDIFIKVEPAALSALEERG